MLCFELSIGLELKPPLIGCAKVLLFSIKKKRKLPVWCQKIPVLGGYIRVIFCNFVRYFEN